MISGLREYPLLKPHYKRLTATVGTLGGILGFVLLVALAMLYASLLNVDMNASMDAQANGDWWLVLLFTSLFPAFYLGGVLVATLAAMFLSYRGQMERREAIQYALFSRYPTRWLKPGAAEDEQHNPGAR